MARFLFIAFFAVLSGSLHAGPEEDFAAANRLYEDGKFAEAASAYEGLAADRLSADLFYNLGAAKQRVGESGAAVLWMRRALLLDSGLAEARQSLNFLRTRLGFLEFANRPVDRMISRLPASFARWSVAIAGWIAALGIAAALLVPRLRPNRVALITVAIVALLFAGLAWQAGVHRAARIASENFAIVIAPQIEALTAPTPDAKAVIPLPPGSELRLLQASGAWSYVEIPGDLRGWVRTEAIAPVWPPQPSKS